MKTMATNVELRTECINKNTCNQKSKHVKSPKRPAAKNKRKSEKLYENYEAQTSVCVAPLPNTMTRGDLVLFMGRFGKILKSHMGKNFFLVEYDTKEAVNVLLTKTNWLENETLYLKRVKQKNLSYFEDKYDNLNEDKASQPAKRTKENKRVPIVIMAEDLLSYNTNIRYLIKEITEFDDEMATLFEAIELTESEIKAKYDGICGHLEEIFKSVFPQCQLYRFGSTMAGLGFKNSDLDMYLHIGDIGPRSTHYKPDISFQEYAQAVLKKLKRIMYSKTTVFSNIIAIPKARTPVIKFSYIPTNVSCDITFKNCFGIYKTNFLKFCASHDVRVKQLMLLIKYWAKEYKLTGVGRMPNYGLMCLIIFYLQTVDVLPTLMELRKNCTPLFVGDWQINFNENYRRTASSSTSSQNVVDLLRGFFQFVKENLVLTPTKKHCGVLSLLDGNTYDKDEFDEVNGLPDYMNSYKNHILHDNGRKLEIRNLIAIQDPIELNQNAVLSANESTLREFHQHCHSAVNCIESAKKKNYQNLLKDLMERSLPPPPPLKAKHRIHIGRFLNIGLSADFDSRTDISNKWEYKKNNWCFIMFNLIKDILEMVFKFTVNVYLDDEACNGELDVLPEELVKTHEEVHFHCVGNKCVLHNRAKHNRIFLDVQLSYLEKEAIISDEVLKEVNQQGEQNDTSFKCKYTVSKTLKSEAVDIKLYQEKGQKNAYDLSPYLYKWIPQILDKTMTHMLQYNKSYSQLYHCKKQKSGQTVKEQHCS